MVSNDQWPVTICIAGLSSIGLVKQIEDIQGLSEIEDIKVIEDYTTSVRTNRINLQDYLSPKIALQKKLKACDRDIVNIQVKSRNNVEIQLNTAAYQLLIQKLIPFLLKQDNTKIEIVQSMDAAKNITQDTIKVSKNQNIQRRSQCSHTINCYWTTSNIILVNSPYIDNFQSNEMKTVIDILELKKIQIQSTNSHLKKILSNAVTNNPATTINNTDSISGKQHTPDGKKMDDSTTETEENNNFFDPKEKEIANKTQ